jgi:hypothetical protein
MPEKSILDARLAEIDRRLRTIQSGLRPAAEAAQTERDIRAPVVAPEAAPVPQRVADLPARPAGDERPAIGEVARLVAQLTALVQAHERLLASTRDLTARDAHDLTDRRRPAGAGAGAGAAVSVSAGPFAGTEALRRFELALQTLPEVSSAVVREYEGADRAIVDVHLSGPTP